MSLGIDAEGLGRRSCACTILLRFYEHSSRLGFAQGLPDSEAISHHAQKPCLHPLLRPVRSQQMGFLICPIPCDRLLLYYAYSGLYSNQSTVHRFCPEQRHYSSHCISRHRGRLPHWCQHSSAMDGQEDQRVQHLHCSHQLHQRHLLVSFHFGLQSTGKLVHIQFHVI